MKLASLKTIIDNGFTGIMSERNPAGTGLSRFLLAARLAAVAVCAFMELFGRHAPSSFIAIPAVLAELFLYNFLAGAYGMTAWRNRRIHQIALLTADLLEASVIVAITGGYESPNFPLFLFAMAETAVVLEWRMGTALIVTINAIQVLVTGVQMAALRNSASFSLIENRFFRLLVVGLLFVILAESLRREEFARRSADRASAETSRLNAIFAQLGQAHLDIGKIFETVFAAALSIDRVLFSAILYRTLPENEWNVAASSREAICPVGLQFNTDSTDNSEPRETLRPYTLTGPAVEKLLPCAATIGCRQLVACSMPSYSPEQTGMLVVGRGTEQPLSPDDETFLQALSLQSQLATHNSLLLGERERQFEQLDRFKRMQETFFAASAHELKTPLTVLELLLSTVKMTIPHPTPDQREMLRTMAQNVARLQTQTRNMLSAARLSASDMALSLRLVDPKRITRAAATTLRMVFRDKQIHVRFRPESPWRKFQADPVHLQEVFSNLLSNAAKFAPERSVVSVTFSHRTDSVQFSVCDQGPGVPESERERIFERFTTAENAGARGGTGLGLYVVRELVRLHGGTAWLDADSGATCFRFSLPLIQSEEVSEHE